MRANRMLLLAGMLLAGALVLAQTGKQPPAAAQAMGKPQQARIERGKKVYELRCAICHYTATAEPKIGPGMKGVTKRGKFTDGSTVDDAVLRRWIEKGGKDMPAYEETLKREEVDALMAYLKTL